MLAPDSLSRRGEQPDRAAKEAARLMEMMEHGSYRADASMGNVPQRTRERPSRLRPVSGARALPLERRTLGLGWFSIGLGLAQLLAPRQVARLIGADEDDPMTRATLMGVGVRELTCGVGLLSRSRPAAWAWARFAGDVMDLALLGRTWQTNPASRAKMLGVGGTVLGAAWADAQTAIELGRMPFRSSSHGISVKQAVTVQRTREEAYAFFRDLENLPRFMAHLDSVVETGARSRWRAKGPLGSIIEWEAEVVADRPGEHIAWRSLPGADVPNRGQVSFRPAPGELGTEITVELGYDPPLGAVGNTVAKLFGREPAQEISADLRRLKQVLETGEVLHSDASVHHGMHPACPAPPLSNQTKPAVLSKQVHS
jgi:uncharacterized membrane protein